jgi:WD40 repeat protein
MIEKVWPFLVSANNELDYREVVAPDFMCQENCTAVLRKAAGAKVTPQDTAYYRKIINSKVGDLTLVFRGVKAVATEADIAGDGILKDPWKRDIYLIEGIVFKENVSLTNIVVNSEDFDKAHNEVIKHYRQFWYESSLNAYPSKEFPLSIKTSGDDGFRLIPYKKDYVSKNQSRKSPEPVNSKSSSDRSRESSSVQIPDSPKYASDRSWKFSYLPFSSNGEIQSIAIFPKGDKIAIRYSPKNIWDFSNIVVWDTKQQKTLQEFSCKRAVGAYETPVVIDYRGSLMASAMISLGETSIIKIWNTETWNEKDLGSQGNCLDRFKLRNITQPIGIKAIAFTPDSTKVISGGDDGSLELRYADEAGKISIAAKHDTGVTCMAVDSKNKILASGDQKGNIKIWQLEEANITEKMLIDDAHRLPVSSLAFSPDGKILASGSQDYTIKLWNMKTGKPCDRLQREHSTFVNSVAFSPNGSLIASGDDGGIIKIWNLKNERSVVLPKTHDDAVTSVVFTRDGKLISGGKDGKLIKWEPAK